MVPKLAPKVRNREEARERKALAAARVERAIERELLQRLRSGAYGDQPLNVSETIWKKVLNGLERTGEGENDEDLDEGIEEEENEEEYEDEDGAVEYVSDLGEDESELGDDIEDWLGSDETGEESSEDDEDDSDSEASDDKAKKSTKRKRAPVTKSKPKKYPRMEVEYEEELETDMTNALKA